MPSQTKTITADLCPQKPDAKILEVGDTKVTVTVTIDARGPLPSSKVDRCVASATQEVNRYAQVISQEIKTLEGKVRDLIKKNDSEGAKKMAASLPAPDRLFILDRVLSRLADVGSANSASRPSSPS